MKKVLIIGLLALLLAIGLFNQVTPQSRIRKEQIEDAFTRAARVENITAEWDFQTAFKMTNATPLGLLRLSASNVIQTLGPTVIPAQIVRKTANESVNASTALQNDDALLAALAANEVVHFLAFIHHDCSATSDIKFAFTVPTSATISWGLNGGTIVSTGGTLDWGRSLQASGTASAIGTESVGAANFALLSGTVVNSTNAGNLQLQWAQNTSDATNCTVQARSILMLFRE